MIHEVVKLQRLMIDDVDRWMVGRRQSASPEDVTIICVAAAQSVAEDIRDALNAASPG